MVHHDIDETKAATSVRRHDDGRNGGEGELNERVGLSPCPGP
jgi:hypothetical protein